ncbi:MAG: hypothetical protein IJ026_04020 [Candidatus Methanomethylophilaceae archaeon]|nr:hypothetical protein [Candidatus Methanomethylophilaceae archaeon]
MAFEQMSCPYCGGTIAPADDRYKLCHGCGKRIYNVRSQLLTFTSSVEDGERFVPIIEMIDDDNLQKALSTVEEMIEDGASDADTIFVRGLVHCYMGEDGRALNDWKKGLEMLETFYNIDCYICMMGKAISDLIYYKETEFITFSNIQYIDRIADALYECTGDSCKYSLYHTVYKSYVRLLADEEVPSDDSLFLDIVPGLFRRVIECQRNYRTLIDNIDELLNSIDYDDETYEDDDNYECHLYYLVKLYLEAYTKEMDEDDHLRIMCHWNDSNMKVLIDHFETLASCVRDDGLLDKLRRSRNDECMDLTAGVNAYVKDYLLITEQESEEPEMV